MLMSRRHASLDLVRAEVRAGLASLGVYRSALKAVRTPPWLAAYNAIGRAGV